MSFLSPLQIGDNSSKSVISVYTAEDGALSPNYPATNTWGDIYSATIRSIFGGKTGFFGVVNIFCVPGGQFVQHRIYIDNVLASPAPQFGFITTLGTNQDVTARFFSVFSNLAKGEHTIRVEGKTNYATPINMEPTEIFIMAVETRS